jgi:CDP-glucose 4,6-dehydratase
MVARNGAVESLVINREFWAGQRVFLTGHTGFKGAWMSLVLSTLGARVTGFALAPESEQDLFVVADVAADVDHRIGDIRNLSELCAAMTAAQPTIVIHMAAQALVRRSYDEPVETYATNVMGTVHVLEVVRQLPTVRAVVVVTSDKCYENLEWPWGYREVDRLGGRDPYSNSKSCAELVTTAYRSSFFGGADAARIATGRAGNVIGGGDWARDRLVPDAVRAFLVGEPLRIRRPNAIRPWQHVLDPIVGYLFLAEKLASGAPGIDDGWNFGPAEASEVPVRTVVDALVRKWGGGARWEQDGSEQPHEAGYLKLDCSKTHASLGWRPQLDLDNALDLTLAWYRAFRDGAAMRQITLAQIALVFGEPTSNSCSAKVVPVQKEVR